MKHLILLALLFSLSATSQSYTKEVIKLWESNSIPFNKEEILLQEKVDSTGRRISQISEPVLYVYRKKGVTKKAAALLYCPGGGYAIVSIKDDGKSYAERFLEMDFNLVAVLKYRLPDDQIVNTQEVVPLCDAQKALAILHQRAEEWKINSEKIGVMGGSAGGHLAACLVNLKDTIIAPQVQKEQLKVAFSVLMYPVISFNQPYRHKGSYKRLLGKQSNNQDLLDYYSMENQVSPTTPPTFIIHATDDESVVYNNSLLYIEKLEKFGIDYKYQELEKGGHGFGFNFEKTGKDWTPELSKWLNTQLKK